MLLALSLVFPAVADHSKEEVIQMVERGLTDNARLVVKWKDDVRAIPQSLSLRNHFDYSLRPLFRRGAETYRLERRELEMKTRESLPHLENYQSVQFRRPLAPVDAVAILRDLYRKPGIAFAYFEPHKTPADIFDFDSAPNATPVARASAVPNYEPYQFHLEAAPRGVDAFYAWTLPGGDGTGVKIVDIEFGWRVTHEEFKSPFHQVNGANYIDHGTAVWGEVAAKRNNIGVSGIAHNSDFGVHAIFDSGSYEQAAAKLGAGDVLIIELQQSGPDNSKYTAMEYWQADFDAMKSITARGVIVVAAAGNGNSNFDAPAYNGAFDLSIRDSGAIIVGAAGSPGSNHLRRMYFSNYGSRLDVFAYGENVVTTGYGDLFNSGADALYTKKFAGTSSATPIVAGSVASLQGIAIAKNKRLTPKEIRDALRLTGTAQIGPANERIGRLPNLKELVAHFE